MNLKKPTYNTVKQEQEGFLSVFISTLVFNGLYYTSELGRNKKEVEQLAARAIIIPLLGIFFLYDYYEVVFKLFTPCVF